MQGRSGTATRCSSVEGRLDHSFSSKEETEELMEKSLCLIVIVDKMLNISHREDWSMSTASLVSEEDCKV